MKPIYILNYLFLFFIIPAKAITVDSLQPKFYFFTDVMNFAQITSLAEEVGTLNPDNSVADINKFNLGLYIRPDITFKLLKERTLLQLFVQPRLNLAKGEGFFFQEFKLKLHLTNKLYFTGGRYVKELGTGILMNPTNPFLFNPTFLNPKIEQKPLGFAELNYLHKDWNFSIYTNYGKANNPIYEEPLFDFHPSYGVAVERFKSAESSGVFLNLGKDKRFHLGAYNLQTVSTALLVWAEIAISRNLDRFTPVIGHWTNPALINYDMVNDGNENMSFSGIFGFSYALKIGPTLKMEYLYNERGYSVEEFAVFNDMIDASSRYNFDITKDLAKVNLARAINTGIPFIRRNYLLTQLGGSGLFDRIDYNVRLLYCMDDFSAQFSTLLEWNIADLQLFWLSIFNGGDRQSDLKRLLNSQIMIGIIYKL